MNMSPVGEDILRQLNEIENMLLATGLYTRQAPDAKAYESELPFCCDYMQFHEWLQWVLIPGTRHSLTRDRVLPFRNPIAVVAETEMAGLPQDTNALLCAIRKLDDLFRQL